ncbi:MAG: hypothetical protein HYZ81_03975 [Nitrospinae bacterium]|nr:hypothetical protein [Nitrospinota bacterium]
MVQRAAQADILPQWTRRVMTDLGGRDPLGLSRVAQLLTDHLLPGIITTTDRARYYALYCWILWHIQREERPDRWETFVSAFQRREAAVAMATLIMDENASPVGKRAASRQLAQGRQQGKVNTAFQVLPANPRGGFGQYYAGCLSQLGLTHHLDDGIDRATEGMAEQLAHMVHRNLAQTPYLRSRWFEQSTVSLKALEQSSERLGLDAIMQSFAGDERRLLVDLFFGFHEEIPNEATLLRRNSLARLLAIVTAHERAGITVEEESLEAQLVYGPTYFGVLVDARNRAKPFTVPASLQRCSDFWRQFSLHQFLTQALEGLLVAVLQIIGGRPGGSPLDSTMGDLLEGRFIGYLERAVRVRCRKPYELLGGLRIAKVPNEAISLRLRDRYACDHALSEWVCEDDVATPAELAARSCLLLAILYGKWRGIVSDVTYAAVAERTGSELAAPTLLPLLDSWLEAGRSWDAALCDLILLIIRQHDRVMYGKGRLESCWLHIEDGRYVCDQDYVPYFRSSRHKQAVEILVDIGLLKWTSTRSDRGSRRLTITVQGRRVLARVLSEGI